MFPIYVLNDGKQLFYTPSVGDCTNASELPLPGSAASELLAGATSTRSGILHPAQLEDHIEVQRAQCCPEISRWVEGYWQLHWSMPGQQSYLSQVLPHPTVSLSVEHGDTRDGLAAETVVVTGVPTRRFEINVRGEGTVFGIKFRPGGFTAMFGIPANALRDLTLPAEGLVPQRVNQTLAGLEPTLELSNWTARVDHILATALPPHDPDYELFLKVIKSMLTDRTLLSVSQIEHRVGIGRRKLQRMFSHYVGVSPKWVLSRYRMHDVVTALDDGYDGLLTELAVSFGWYDQSHFIRDFSALIGATPSDYRVKVQHRT